MTENKINIFLRIRPTKKQLSNYEIVDDGQGLVIDIPKENQAVEVINNTKERHEFRFNKVFDREARQEEIFQDVALPAVTAALDGFNGTIFAYGQTGSGKTFTMTGGPEKYADRGIIPRTLSHIYNELRRRSDYSYQIHVSYLEIYNNNGYDLLDPSLEEQAKQLEDLPKVSLQEDEDGELEPWGGHDGKLRGGQATFTSRTYRRTMRRQRRRPSIFCFLATRSARPPRPP